MIKNAKFVEEVSQEFDKDDEIVVVCALSCYSYESSQYQVLTKQGSKSRLSF
jgi:hypothetical protein